MELSQRIKGINGGGSDGWGIFYRARQMKAEGRAVTELTIGEHDIRTDPLILNHMHKTALAGTTGYAMIPGIAPLREAVAKRVQAQTGVQTLPENVLITAGGQAALYAAHHAVCNPGDRAMFIDPHYATYPGTVRANGAIPVPVPARPEAGFQPDPAVIAAHAEGATSLLINSPNNPTGVIYSRETLEGIARVVQDKDLWLISDEVYDTQVWDGAHLSPRTLPGMAERTLVIGSMSKSHAMTGSRIGWIIGPVEAITHLINLATNTNYGVPGYIQEAALFALTLGADFEARIAEPFQRRRAIALDLLARQNAVRAVPPQGAMYTMLDIRATGLDGNAFAAHLLEEHGIAVMPGESFGQAATGHIRVAMTIPDAPFSAAFQTLLDVAGELAGQA
ncbi:aminotransferase class I/II-fold pyridoxal phosphate-dependent enzyme [Thalassobius vesicularis]|uniref:Aminotransferase n=1 Tax=Thalassobius vesicularis TaxID=1294297 RepID=A0A4S3MDG5_9RHOB|nr:aminotransferase class I/II-fold pyridoxal phosphate-dependent enzyme [Thalassobius vesicularis]THD75061.1 aminotransferase class I/II-fold pyridoxal phosphate-dependent enzyme [Thalassobius vesicularis]